MSENTPETTPPPEPESEEQSGHAVYDLTLRRFVGGVRPTKKAATDAVVKVKGHEYETRKV